jgi:hypothetical protein
MDKNTKLNHDAKVAVARMIAKHISSDVLVGECVVDDWNQDCSEFHMMVDIKLKSGWPFFVYNMDYMPRLVAATRTMRTIRRGIKQCCTGHGIIGVDATNGYGLSSHIQMPRAVYLRERNGRKRRAGYEGPTVHITLRVQGWDHGTGADKAAPYTYVVQRWSREGPSKNSFTHDRHKDQAFQSVGEAELFTRDAPDSAGSTQYCYKIKGPGTD